jgi:hypothetical protein
MGQRRNSNVLQHELLHVESQGSYARGERVTTSLDAKLQAARNA